MSSITDTSPSQPEAVEENKKQRVQFYFEPEAIEAVDKMRKRTKLRSRAEVVRYALKFFEWLLDELKEGGEILVRRPNGELKGIILPFR